MHDVVKTGGQLLLATLILIIITWAGEAGRARRDFKLFTEVNNGACFLPQKQKLFLARVWLPTRADCDGFHKLLSPAVRPDHQGQVGPLQEFIHGALKDSRPANHQTMKSLKETAQIMFLLILWHIIPSVWSQIRWSIWELIVCFRFVRDNARQGVHY